MNSNLQYNGKVTIKFYNKDGKLKGTHIQYNHGTPYLFSVIEKVLAEGTDTLNDDRPGRIMLTSPGYIINGGNKLKLVNGRFNEGLYYLDGDSSLAQLSYNIPRVSTPSYMHSLNTLKDNGDKDIPAYTPCIRYEFNISYYDLLKSIASKVGSLDRYRLWLISSNDTSFRIDGTEILIENPYPSISGITTPGAYIEDNPLPEPELVQNTSSLSLTDIDKQTYYILLGTSYNLASIYDSSETYYYFNKYIYYTRSGSGTSEDPYVYNNATIYDADEIYFIATGPTTEADEDILMESLLNNITYNNVDVVSLICALTLIKKLDYIAANPQPSSQADINAGNYFIRSGAGTVASPYEYELASVFNPTITYYEKLGVGNEVDYTLNEGEYITVLWDMYFQNNPVSEVNE